MPGCPAAVTDTESPSQLIPSEIHRMWTSSTPGAFGSVAIARPSCRQQRFLELERVAPQLLAGHDVQLPATAGRAHQREGVQLALAAARPADARGRDVLEDQLRTLRRRVARHELEGELQGRRHDLAQVADAHLDPR